MSGDRAVLNGRYEIERELGRGGMSVVFLAKDLQLLSRRVVVKVLLEQVSADEWGRKKFLQEMEALARIDHPGVVGVLDTGLTDSGKQFLVMQFVEGSTLRKALEAGVTPERAAGILRQIGQALAAAHEKGVFHRDLKPENVMLQSLPGGDERAILIDFGIAGIKDSAFKGDKTMVAGSSAYMAPEQFEGRPCPASDTYALGVVAYEMLTGQKPFASGSFTHLVSPDAARIPAPRELRAGIPEAADRAIRKAMSFRPEDRHATVREFSEELFVALTSGGAAPPEVNVGVAPPNGKRRIRPALIAVLAFALVAVSALAAWRFWFQPAAPGEPLELSYSITVQRYRDGEPFGDPFRLPGEIVFEKDYRIKVSVASSHAGYLYIANLGVSANLGRHTLRLLEPRDGQSAVREAGFTAVAPSPTASFRFDTAVGRETLYLVWAREPSPELERLKGWPQQEAGDPAEVQRIEDFLDSQARGVDVRKDQAARETRLRTTGKVLVHAIPLEHL